MRLYGEKILDEIIIIIIITINLWKLGHMCIPEMILPHSTTKINKKQKQNWLSIHISIFNIAQISLAIAQKNTSLFQVVNHNAL